tara:strand:- start:89 stop:334 length:246 start_codon:yes stop_codon:yes gene_type:complete
MQFDGLPFSAEKFKTRKFKKYWKAKTKFLEEQGVHFAIGEAGQPHFSAVTRVESNIAATLIDYEKKFKIGMTAVILELFEI